MDESIDKFLTEEQRRRNQAVIALINEWAADESDYDEKTLEQLDEALNANRRREGDYRMPIANDAD